jgi:hypothetical protein
MRLSRFGVLVRPGRIIQVITILTLVNLVLLSVVGYRGFHYMDSTEFCGEVCHQVMMPEFTAYKRSPHASVECVQCHIGPGAEWFVKAKLSGARQVLAVIFDTYHKPIKTPVENLRPAREVCESCHRPELFHGDLIQVRRHFTQDQDNTPKFTVLNMRVGGGGDQWQAAEGIHWHVSKDHKLRYYATDREREKIVWIQQVNADGTTRVWTRPGKPIDEADIDPAELRTMDCVDCHNRPTHIYLPPAEAIEARMRTGELDPDLPWIRKIAEEVIVKQYDTTEAAMQGIEQDLAAAYREGFQQLWATRQRDIINAAQVLKDIYRQQVFPQMNIQWNTYESLIGHPTKNTQRCFRCHDGLFRDEAGDRITLDCDSCHYILAEQSQDPSILRILHRSR